MAYQGQGKDEGGKDAGGQSPSTSPSESSHAGEQAGGGGEGQANQQDSNQESQSPDTTGDYGTQKSSAELANEATQAAHDKAAKAAFDAGDYGEFISQKFSSVVDETQGFFYEQARELTQAPLDKIADITRSTPVRSIASIVGGVPALAATAAIGLIDNAVDYTQGEASAKDAALDSVGDLMSFAPEGVREMYTLVTNPTKSAKQFVSNKVKTGNPLVDLGINKAFSYAFDNIQDSINQGVNFSGSEYASPQSQQLYASSRTTQSESNINTNPYLLQYQQQLELDKQQQQVSLLGLLARNQQTEDNQYDFSIS